MRTKQTTFFAMRWSVCEELIGVVIRYSLISCIQSLPEVEVVMRTSPLIHCWNKACRIMQSWLGFLSLVSFDKVSAWVFWSHGTCSMLISLKHFIFCFTTLWYLRNMGSLTCNSPFIWPTINWEYVLHWSFFMPISLARTSPVMRVSYLAWLLEVLNLRTMDCSIFTSPDPFKTIPVPLLLLLEDPSTYKTQAPSTLGLVYNSTTKYVKH